MTPAKKRRRLPPRRKCQRCRREFRGWRATDCPTCKVEGAVMAAGTADAVREAREVRRGGSSVGGPPSAPHDDEQRDEIPY